MSQPYVVALGGTTRENSSTEKALRVALEGAASLGARTLLIGGKDLDFVSYAPENPYRCDASQRLVTELRKADGIILGSPGYHGGVSGLVKNAIDYTEDMSSDDAPYFHGKVIGCVATGAGWQGAMTTLAALRNIVHALRGWPTPFGAAINTAEPVFDADGACLSKQTDSQLRLVGTQVMDFLYRPTFDPSI